MQRFRVSDLMINVGEGTGGGCNLITECGEVTFLCVEDTQGCAFTENCRCTIHTACGDELTCQCSVCTPCSARTCGCTCTACSVCTVCTVHTCGCTRCSVRTFCTPYSVCGISIGCTPTFAPSVSGGLTPEHLGRLKEALRSRLEELEAHEQRLKERMQPQTLEEVDQLEKKMTEALEELRRRREELEEQEQGEKD